MDAIIQALADKDEVVIDDILEHGLGMSLTGIANAKLTEDGWVPSKWTASLKAIQFLIEHGLDPNIHDGTLLIHASSAGNLDIVEYLLLHGANHCDDALVDAVINEHIDVVKCLLKHGAHPDDDILDMCFDGNIARLLLDHGAKLSQEIMEEHIVDDHIETFKIFVEEYDGARFLKDGELLKTAVHYQAVRILDFLSRYQEQL